MVMWGLRQLALPLAGCAGLFLLAAPAAAQPQEIVVTGKMKIPEGFEAVKRVVSLKGLDLATAAGAAELQRRVDRAVNNICATPPPRTKQEKLDTKACSDFAWAGARPQIDRALQRARGR
jgi:UrcA family protein